MDKQRFLSVIKEIEAGLKYRETLDKFKQGDPGAPDGTWDDRGMSAAELKALKEEAENKHGRWQN